MRRAATVWPVCVFALAWPPDGDSAHHQPPLVISRTRTSAVLGFDDLVLVNDFAAQAMAILLLQPGDVMPVGGARWSPDAVPRDRVYAVIGPGTGLGVGILVLRDGNAFPLETEGGHVSFPPGTESFWIPGCRRRRAGSNERMVAARAVTSTALCRRSRAGPARYD